MAPDVALRLVARHLTLVQAPASPGDEVLHTVEPALRAALDGERPLAVLPAGPSAVVRSGRSAMRPEEPLEDGADLVVVTSGSTGRSRGVLLPASAVRASAAATLD